MLPAASNCCCCRHFGSPMEAAALRDCRFRLPEPLPPLPGPPLPLPPLLPLPLGGGVRTPRFSSICTTRYASHLTLFNYRCGSACVT
jgi:hypothetical protein